MKAISAGVLFALLAVSILTSWIPDRRPTALLEVGAFLLALAWIITLAISGQRPRLAAVLAPAAFFVAWGLVQLACHWTVAASETVRAVLGWAANLSIVFIALQTFDQRGPMRRFLQGLLWFAFAVAAAAILLRLASPVRDSFTMGPFLYHNHFAAFIELVLPLALLQTERRAWYAFVSATLIGAVIVSASRSGVALVLIETVAAMAINRRRAAILVAAMAAAMAILGWDALALRLREDRPYYDRLQMLHSSWDMFRDRPLTGAGLGNWPIAFPYYARYDDGLFANQAHNDWAQAAAEAGLPGLAAFAAFFVLAIRQARRNPWCMGVAIVFLHALVDYPFHKPQIAGLVCAMCAMQADSPRRHGEHKES